MKMQLLFIAASTIKLNITDLNGYYHYISETSHFSELRNLTIRIF